MDGALYRLVLALGLAGALAGCTTDEPLEAVTIWGEMTVGPELGDPYELIGGAHLDAYDDTDTVIARGEEPWPGDRPGYYRVPDVPPETHVQLVAFDDVGELVPTVHAAWTPPNHLFVTRGEIFALRHGWLYSRLALLSKDGVGPTYDDVIDPDHAGGPGFVLGSVADPEAAVGLRITVHAAGEPYETLYLDELGIARDELTSLGPGGEFAVFGVPAGPIAVQVTRADGTDLEPMSSIVHEEGCTALYGLEVTP